MRKFLCLFVSLFIPVIIFAGHVTEQQALQKAQRFMKGKCLSVANTKAFSRGDSKETDPFYIFNAENKGGFVIVSGDDRTEEILGYSDNGNIDIDNIPDNMRALLESYEEQIHSLRNITIAKKSFQNEKPAIDYLVKSKWDGGSPYNLMCPKYSYDNRCAAGCVAVALAQIMYYYKYPKDETVGIPAYTTKTLKLEMPALPPTTFKWDKMKDEYDEEMGWNTDSYGEAEKAVAELIRYCGQAIQMNYNYQSAPGANDISDGMVYYLGFSKTFKNVSRYGYSSSEWEDLMYGEIKEGRPVMLFASNHAFLCDGYDGNGYFHINWGWGGVDDGYYLFSLLRPDDMDRNDDIHYVGFVSRLFALIGLEPDYSGEWRQGPQQEQEECYIFNYTYKLSCNRDNVNESFNMSIRPGVSSDPSKKVKYQGEFACGFYKDDELWQIVPCTLADENDENEKWTLSFGSGWDDGKYKLSFFYRKDDTEKWKAVLTDIKYDVVINGLSFEATIDTGDHHSGAFDTNIEITSVNFIDEPIKDETGIITVYLKNSGTSYVQQLTFWSGDKKIATGIAHIDPKESGFISFGFTPNKFGTLQYEIKLLDYNDKYFPIYTGEVYVWPFTKITVDPFSVNIGGSKQITIRQESKGEKFNGYSFRVVMPDGLSLEALDESVIIHNEGNGIFLIEMKSFDDSILSDDVLCTLNVKAQSNVCFGKYSIKMEDVRGYTSEESYVELRSSTSEMFINCTPLELQVEAGQLSDILGTRKDFVSELKIRGNLNGDDFRILRSMAGKNHLGQETEGQLRKLDLSEANIVSGGDFYYFDTGEYFKLEKDNEIPKFSFISTLLEEIVLPISVKKIQSAAFEYCYNLQKVIIPYGVEEILDISFAGCSNLSSVIVGNGVKFIAHNAFDGTAWYNNQPSGVVYVGNIVYKYKGEMSANTIISIEEGTIGIADYAFRDCIGLKSVAIPSSVTFIGIEAFEGCSCLTSVTIPNGVISIGYGSFFGCQGLSSITIPANVSIIGGNIFVGCQNLSEVIVSQDNMKYASEDGVLFNKDKTELICYPEGKQSASYSIPTSVTEISGFAFHGSTFLSTILCPKNLRSIENSAFGECTSLETIVIPRRIQSIGGYAFSNCKALHSITSESEAPFDIEDNVFGGNQSGYPQENVDIYSTATLYVPTGTKALYQSKTGWRNFKNIKEIEKRTIHVSTAGTLPDLISEEEKYNIEELTLTGELNGTDFRLLRDMAGNNYLGERTNGILKVLDFSEAKIVAGGEKYLDTDNILSYWSKFYFSIEKDNELPQHIFHSCKLTSVCISNKVTKIGESAFEDSPSLSSVTIPYGVKNIGRNAFHNCNSLSTISIPQSVTSIGSYAFGDCKSLSGIIVDTNNDYYCSDSGVLFNKDKTTLILYPQGKTDNNYIVPGGVTRIEGWAFVDNHYLSSVTIPSSVTFIGGRLFDCDGLKEIFVDSGNNHFSSIDGVLFNKDLTTILRYPISKSWTHYTVPSTVTSIGNTSFSNCRYLASVELPNSVTSIEDNAFFGSKSLTSIHLSTSLATIGSWAFEECSLTTITIPNSVTSIKDNAFVWCNNLTSVIVWRKTPLNLTENAFPHRENATLYVPAGCIDAYTNTDYWKEFKEIKELEEMAGDANGDGNVDKKDLELVIEFIMTCKEPEGFVWWNADTNGDNMINVEDVVQIVKIRQ